MFFVMFLVTLPLKNHQNLPWAAFLGCVVVAVIFMLRLRQLNDPGLTDGQAALKRLILRNTPALARTSSQ